MYKNFRANLISDNTFKIIITVSAIYILIIVSLLITKLFFESYPIWHANGLSFIVNSDWNTIEGRESFGALPYILGTMITSAIAMAIAIPFSIGIAMFVSYTPQKLHVFLNFIIDLLASIPSIIYGLWGLIIFRPIFIKSVEIPIHDMLGKHVWLFSGIPMGLDIITASIVLSIMIIPTISSVSREIIKSVPIQQQEAAFMLGATEWEIFKLAIFPYSKAGLVGASILGLGRAVGETMAITMLIGNATGNFALPKSLFQAGQTMSSIIANEFIEAPPLSLHLSALIGIGLILLLFAICINIIAHILVIRMLKVQEGSINT
ncbi:MAG: phosphate ABC transporter permease subunit PstC [Thaumarchaeota archaeon]|nr:phosphate ABC transporter permease subunit PstC [Nitrososphaerota archaeon]MCY3976243.1 phosphate ABC transporter permease subunit PstC [Nitrososphaerota archaeon]